MAILKRALIVLAILLLIPVVVLVAAFAYLTTAHGLSTIASVASNYASSDETKIAIGDIEGSFPYDLTLKDVRLGDRKGEWLTVDRARVVWSPLSLYSAKLKIDLVDLGRVAVAREPDYPEKEENLPPPDPNAPLFPELPIEIHLDRFALADLDLAQPVMGVPARLAATASAMVRKPKEGVSADFDVRRTDGTKGQFSGKARFIPATQGVEISLRGSEPAGGLIARLAEIPGLPPIDIGMEGAGTLDALRTQLVVTAGTQGRIDGAGELRREGKGRRVTLELGGDVGRMVKPEIAELVRGPTRITANAFVPDEGPIEISETLVDIPAVRLGARGKVDLDKETVDLSYDLRAGDAARFAGFLPGVRWSSLTVLGTAKGPLDHPTINATLDGGALAAPQGAAETARVVVTATPNGPFADEATKIAATVEAQANGVKFADDRLFSLGRELRLSAAATTTPKGVTDVERAELRLADVRASYVGKASPDAITGRATVKAADLSTLSGLAGRDLAGSLDLASDLDVAFDMSKLEVSLDGAGAGLKTSVPQVDALTGGALRIRGGVSRGQDGSFTFRGFDARGDHVLVTADGSVTETNADAKIRAEIDDLALVDANASGRATATADLTGRLDDLGLKALIAVPEGKVLGRALEKLEVRVDAGKLTGDLAGTLALSGSLDRKPITGGARLVTEPSGARRIENLDIAIASTTVKGAVTALPGGIATGSVAIDSPDLSEIGALALTELAGALKGDIALSEQNGVQRVVVKLDGQKVSAPGAKIDALKVDAAVLDPAGKVTVDGTVSGSGIVASGQAIDTLSVVARGAPNGMDVTLDMGAKGSSAKAAARVAYAPNETRIDLSRLDLAGGGKTAALNGPATVRVGAGAVAIDAFSLRAGEGGVLDLSGTAGETLDLNLVLRELPLALSNAFTPGLDMAGTAQGTAKLSGAAGAPVADYDFSVAGLSIAKLRNAKVPPLSITTRGRLEGPRVTTDTRVTGAGGLEADVTGSAPIGEGELDMNVRVRSLPLALANAFQPELGFGGRLEADARVTGPVTAPNGTYRAKVIDFTSVRARGVAPISVDASGELQGARVTTDATIAGAGGVRAAAKGFAPLGKGDVDMAVNVAELPLAIANAFAPELGLGGVLRGDLRVSGPVDTPRGSYDLKISNLVAAPAKGVPALEIQTRGALEGERATTVTTVTGGGIDLSAQGSAPLGDGPIDMDVAIRELPLKIADGFLPGSGLGGALTGTAKIGGTAAAPAGTYDLTVKDVTSARAKGVPALNVYARGDFDPKRVVTDALVSGGGGIEASARGSAPIGEGDLDMTVGLKAFPLALANAFVPTLGLGGQAMGNARLTGPVKAPVGTYDLTVRDLTAAQAKGVPPLQIVAKGDLQGERVSTDAAITGAGGISLTAKGSAPIGDGDVDMAVAIRELPLALANGFKPELGLAGVLRGDARVLGPVSAPRGSYDLTIADLVSAQAKGVPALQIATKGALEGNRVTTDTSVTGGGGISLTAKGSAPIGEGDLDMVVAIREFPVALANAFKPELGLAGMLRGDARVAGPVAAPRGTYDLTVSGLTAAQAKGVAPLQIVTKGALEGDRVTTDTAVTGGGGVSVTAKGSAPLGTGDVDMTVAIREVPLALANAVSPSLGLGGRLRGDVKVAGQVTAPQGTYDLFVENLTSAQAKGVPALQITSKGTLEGSRVTTDTAVTGGGGVRLTAKGAAPLGQGDLDMVVDIAELPLAIANGFSPGLGLSGKLAGGAKVAGPISAPTGDYDLRVTGLTAAAAKGVPALQITSKGALASGRVTTDTAITGGGGIRITANGSGPLSATGPLDVAILIRNVPLSLANGFSPGLGANGTLQGEAKVAGTASAPAGTYALKVTGLSTQATRGAGVPAASIDAKGRLDGQRVFTNTVVTAASGLRITANGSAPLGAGDLDLQVGGRAPLGFLNDTLSVSGDRIDGTATFDVKVGGPTSAPRINGSGALQNASYSNRAAGLQLRGLSASVVANGTNINVASLRATTRNGGTISGSGRVSVDPAAGFPGEINFQANNAEVVGTDIVTAITDANLKLQGPLARRPVINGTIRTRSIEIQIPDRIPAQYTPLPEVRHRNAPAAVTRQLKALNTGGGKGGSKEDAFLATLDIDVQADNRIFIRGMGMTAEAGGRIKITGTSAAPQPVGAFELRSGRSSITVIGKRLNFTRGQIGFAGDLDPTLDFLAETPAKGITAQVVITGNASSPKIEFTSNPAVPQDEVLSRLLFDKSSGELTPSQAITLAQAVAQYSGVGGGGAGPLDSLRKGLGVDNLDLGGGSGDGLGLGVGKYISDNIYLGVTQGTSPETTGVTVDIDITKNIKAQGMAGAAGNTSAGVAVEWDY